VRTRKIVEEIIETTILLHDYHDVIDLR
jgi:hypothetical protein